MNGSPGSSPRAWGLFADGRFEVHPWRYIPTCVGFMRQLCVVPRNLSVHPHVRGVYVGILGADDDPKRFIPTCVGFMRSTSFMAGLMFGSSPRAWGLCGKAQGARPTRSVHPHVRGVYAERVWFLVYPERFIPTCVGFMTAIHSTVFRCTVHPHVRGVYCFRASTVSSETGSSPRAWGLFQHQCP